MLTAWVSRYTAKTQENRLNPPRSATIVGMAVATMELSTAAMKVAIRQAASTIVGRPVGDWATWIWAVFGWNPSSGTESPHYGWDVAGFCHRPQWLATCTTAAQPCYSGIEICLTGPLHGRVCRYWRRYRGHFHGHC